MPRVRLGAEAARAAGAGTANGSAGCKVILPCVALRSIGCAPAAYLTRRVESVELRATRPGRLQPLGFIGALSQSRAASVGVEIVAGILSGGYDFLTGTGDAVRMSTWQLTPAAKGAYAAGRIRLMPVRYSRLTRLFGALGVSI